MSKNEVIAARLLAFIANGATVKEAFHYVLGPGYFDCLVEELYAELRAKVAA
jgi:hypothetical protein